MIDKKEYLDENFNLVYGSGVYEVPDNCEAITKCEDVVLFWYKDGKVSLDDRKKYKPCHDSYSDYLADFPTALVWQRNNKCADDNVNHPSHYTTHPSGIECIDITRHHDFAIGNAIKYLWRAGLKDSDNEVQDLKKAIWYIQDKINQLGS